MLSEAKPQLSVGKILSHYRIKALIGSSGMGEVYRATDTRLDRDVAVKILPGHLADDDEALRHFEREAKAIASLSHPNIHAIYDFGSENGVSYAVMELLEGHSLRDNLQAGALGWREAASIGVSLCEGLAAAHDQGIIHRDLKPENIFQTTDWQMKILDFGIAKLKRIVSDDTLPASASPTLGYLSPEQLRGEAGDALNDIFSLGCVLYEMATGVRPFVGETPSETVGAILSEAPASLSESNKDFPAEFEEVVRHCLEKSREKRYSSAREVATDLKAILSRSASTAARRPLAVSARGVLACLLVVGLIVVWTYWRKTSQAKSSEARPHLRSIAVLPFKSLTPDARSEHLGLGLADTVITKLSTLGSLVVRPTGAIVKYASAPQDALVAGKDQNVDTVLDSSIQALGDRLRITVRLLNVSDQREIFTYQCEEVLCDNLFSMQDVIAERVAAALTTSVTGEDRKKLRKQFTQNKEALDAFSRGISYLNKLTREDVQKAIESFKEAIYKDPDYALAYVGLADSYGAMAGWNWCDAKECYPLAKAAAVKAVGIDPELGKTHSALAALLHVFDWNHPEADKEFKEGIRLSPGNSMGHRAYAGYLLTLGRFEEARVRQQRAWELEPGSIMNYVTYWDLYYYSRDYAQAIDVAQKAKASLPDWIDARRRLAEAYDRNGQYDQSVSEHLARLTKMGSKPDSVEKLENAYRTSGRRGFWQTWYNLQEDGFSPQEDVKRESRPIAMYGRAQAYAHIGNKEGVIYCLQQAYKARARGILFIKVEPLFDEVRSDPRFVELLRNVGLEP